MFLFLPRPLTCLLRFKETLSITQSDYLDWTKTRTINTKGCSFPYKGGMIEETRNTDSTLALLPHHHHHHGRPRRRDSHQGWHATGKFTNGRGAIKFEPKDPSALSTPRHPQATTPPPRGGQQQQQQRQQRGEAAQENKQPPEHVVPLSRQQPVGLVVSRLFSYWVLVVVYEQPAE